MINRILLQILLDTKSQANSNPNLPIRDLIAADNKIKSSLFVRLNLAKTVELLSFNLVCDCAEI